MWKNLQLLIKQNTIFKKIKILQSIFTKKKQTVCLLIIKDPSSKCEEYSLHALAHSLCGALVLH